MEKLQRAVSLAMEEKSTASRPGKHRENLQPASRRCREAIAPTRPPIPRYFLRAFLKVSSLQSTTLMYVSLDLRSSVPIYFSENTRVPPLFVCSLYLVVLGSCLLLPLGLFHPFEELG